MPRRALLCSTESYERAFGTPECPLLAKADSANAP